MAWTNVERELAPEPLSLVFVIRYVLFDIRHCKCG